MGENAQISKTLEELDPKIVAIMESPLVGENCDLCEEPANLENNFRVLGPGFSSTLHACSPEHEAELRGHLK